MAEDAELHGIGAAAAVPDWLKGLIRAVRSEAMQPKDARVKSLWDLLRKRQLLNRSLWLKEVLRRIWNSGLPARPRPRTTRQLLELLRRWSVLPPVVAAPAAGHPNRPRTLRPVSARPVAVRPVGVRTGPRGAATSR